MERYIAKAAVLVEALPYIQAYKNKYVVIKYGGSAMVDNEYAESLLRDIVFLECVGIKPVLIHGGGTLISSRMKKAGKHPQFLHGLRVTDDETIHIVDKSLSEINKQIVKKIRDYGGGAKGLTSKEGVITARKHYVEGRDVDSKRKINIDIGYVGDLTKINGYTIKRIADKIGVPVIAPLGVDKAGNLYNINADLVACGVATALKAEKLVLMTDVKGIMEDQHHADTLISTVKARKVERLIKDGIISGGMIPKVRASVNALNKGVHKIHIIDARILHSVLLEIFTDKGVGTQIVI